MLTVGSLFAGIGGLELGLEQTGGFKTLWQVEINPFCHAVLKKWWPNAKKYEDVHEVGAHNLEPVDLVCGGFPCPPVSCAGRGEGQDDERWLWPEFARIIRELEPEWVLVENVPGLLSANAGREFGAVLRDLAASRYNAEWNGIPAAAFGAPHRRERVFLVAYPDVQGPLSLMAEVRQQNLSSTFRQGAGTCHAERRRLQSRVLERRGPWPEVFATGHCTSLGTVLGPSWPPERGEGWLDDGIPGWLAEVYSRLWGNAVVPQCARFVGERILAHAKKQAPQPPPPVEEVLGGNSDDQGAQSTSADETAPVDRPK